MENKHKSCPLRPISIRLRSRKVTSVYSSVFYNTDMHLLIVDQVPQIMKIISEKCLLFITF